MRAFTIYQVADLVINELPEVIKQFDTRLVVVSDLLHMFVHDPNVDCKEAIYLIKEIVSAIRKISSSSSSPRQILGVISWNHHHSHIMIFFFQNLINILKLLPV